MKLDMTSYRRVIDRNSAILCDLTICSRLLLHKAWQRGIFTRVECDEILRHSQGYDRNRAFYSLLRRKNSDTFEDIARLMYSGDVREPQAVVTILMSADPSMPSWDGRHDDRHNNQTTATASGSGTPPPGVGSSILREADIHNIVQTMTRSTPLCLKKLELFLALGLPLANSLNIPDTNHQFFTFTLANWIEQSSAECPPTVERLVNALRSIEMNNVAVSILDLERDGEFHRELLN